MGFLDALFGRTRLQKPDMDRIFALSSAEPSLQEVAGLVPAGRSGVCLQPVEGQQFAEVADELRELVALAAKDQQLQAAADVVRDGLGFTWVIFRDPDLTEAVTLTHLVSSTLQEKGFGEQLLAATFRLRQAGAMEEGPVYLIYNYKRGKFYPFAPRSDAARTRDNALEFRIGAALEQLLPMEKDLTRWYALWECPV